MIGALVSTLCLTAAPAQASAPDLPARITSVTSRPGPYVGQVTISWRTDGDDTKSFQLETALTPFSTTSSLPDHGRQWKTYTLSPKRRSVTLTATQLAASGAPVRSARHVYFRLRAVNTNSTGRSVRSYPYLQVVSPKPGAPSRTGTPLRVASFNIRSVKVSGRSWLSRASSVAAAIKAKNPGVVALQELSPGRADGKSGSTTGTLRQTDSLLSKLKAAGASKYRLVRSTPYIEPGKTHSTQGTRILYDSTRFSLASYCPQHTGKRNFSPSCSMELPVLKGEGASRQRSVGYAVLKARSTGQRFFVVSVHLDHRHSGNATSERRYDGLRKAQMNAVLARIAKLNTSRLPVVVAGDVNSWQNHQVANGPHDRLVAHGFYDTAAAQTTVNLRYSTINHFKTTMPASRAGYGSRLDLIAIQGIRGARKFENVMKVTDASRPSDHNLIYADVVLPRLR